MMASYRALGDELMEKSTSNAILEAAFRAVRTGSKKEAAHLFSQIIMATPDCVDAWQGLAGVIDDPQRKKECYEYVLRLQPGNFISPDYVGDLERKLASPDSPEKAVSSILPIQEPDHRHQPEPALTVPARPALPGKKYCPYCGQINLDAWEYCRYCHKSFAQLQKDTIHNRSIMTSTAPIVVKSIILTGGTAVIAVSRSSLLKMIRLQNLYPF